MTLAPPTGSTEPAEPEPHRAAPISSGLHTTVAITRTPRPPVRRRPPSEPRAATAPVSTVADLRAWPVVGLLLLYPLWWASGLGVIIFPLMAVPMAYMLMRRRILAGTPVRVPPGFLWWLVFLLVVVISIGMLGANPPGTVPDSLGSRVLAVLFRLVEYGALTILMLYVGNLGERQLPRQRLIGLMSWLFGVTVAGGLLGMLAGSFAFDSPIEVLL
ncbi:MAG TPA: O-antigen ligase domain-containing protein, partial [Micromonosporaceae bacterium]